MAYRNIDRLKKNVIKITRPYVYIILFADSFSPNHFSTNDDAPKVSVVAGAMGTVIAILVIIVVLLALIVWRNHIGLMCQKGN